MRAVVIDHPGGPEVLTLREVPDLAPGPDGVVLATTAAGVNRADLMQRQGFYPPPPGAPPYPGLECAGTVTAVGSAVAGWQPGDRVCALLAGSGYAEQVAAPAGQLLPLPDGLGLPEAAALPHAACTVYSNVVMYAGLAPGETLLGHGGAACRGGAGAPAHGGKRARRQDLAVDRPAGLRRRRRREAPLRELSRPQMCVSRLTLAD